MTEEIVLLFIQKSSVLLAYVHTETRKTHFFIPRARINQEEKEQHRYYVEHAMHRQVYKGFHGTVMPLQYDLIDSISKDEENLVSHIYFIYTWDGELPKYLHEVGSEKAKLQWFGIASAEDVVLSVDDRKVLGLAKESVRIRNLLRRQA